jgi:hypothetical protein
MIRPLCEGVEQFWQRMVAHADTPADVVAPPRGFFVPSGQPVDGMGENPAIVHVLRMGPVETRMNRMFAALYRTKAGAQAVESALAEVFPWARHLSAAERSDFAQELIAALSDAAELTIDTNAHEVLAAWRATARIKADKSQHPSTLQPTEGDFGPAEVFR